MAWSIELPDGQELQLNADNNLRVLRAPGAGMPDVQNIINEYALVDGASFQRSRVRTRALTLLIAATGNSYADLRALRRSLVAASNPHRREQPIRIWWKPGGAEPDLYIDGFYDFGLEGGTKMGTVDARIALRFLCPDPFFYGAEDSEKLAASFQEEPVSTIFRFGGPDSINNLDGGLNHSTLAPIVRKIAHTGTHIVAIGRFNEAGGENSPMVPITGNVAAWNKVDEVWEDWSPDWSALPNYALFGSVTDIVRGPHHVYLVAQYLAEVPLRVIAVVMERTPDALDWSVTELWEDVNDPDIFYNCQLAVAPNGDLYVANISEEGQLERRIWRAPNGTAPFELIPNSGLNGDVLDMAFRRDTNQLTIAGEFTEVGGGVYNRIAIWDSELIHLSSLGAGFNDTVRSIQYTFWNDLYCAGDFTALEGGTPGTMNHVAMWQPFVWQQMGAGLNDVAWRFPGGNSAGIVLGEFTATAPGARDLPGGRAAFLSDDRWYPTDHGQMATGAFNSLRDEIFLFEEGTYMAGDFQGNWERSLEQEIVVDGTANCHPIFVIHLPEGQDGILRSIENITTDKRLFFDYHIVPGEELTLDTRPGREKLTSNFEGSVLGDNPLPGSTLSTFVFAPGPNRLLVYIERTDVGGAEVEVFWTPAYWGTD